MRKIMNLKDNIGKKFNRLLVLDIKKKDYGNKRWAYYYTCKCDCGTIKDIRAYFVVNGDTKSCGCYKKEISKIKAYKMGKNTRKHEEKCDYCGAENHFAKGMCHNCYERFRRNGDLEYRKRGKKTDDRKSN